MEFLYTFEIDYGTVLHIDNYGNIKLYAYDDLRKAKYVIVNGHKISIVSNFMLASGALAEKGELVATNGSSFGLIEIQAKAEALGDIGAAEILGISLGDVLNLAIY